MGRWVVPGREDAHVIVFRARPDGLERDVLVAWAEKKVDWPERGKTKAPFSLPKSWEIEATFDYLGRRLDEVPAELAGEAVFVVLPAGQTGELGLESVGRSSLRPDRTCPVVLQVQMPQSSSMKIAPVPWSQGYEYRIDPDEPYRLRMFAYNFTSEPVKGTIRVEDKPSGWTLGQESWSVSVAPMEREAFEATLTIPAGQAGTLRLTGDFGSAANAVLAFRVHGVKSQDKDDTNQK
jgi:hypothetical protein